MPQGIVGLSVQVLGRTLLAPLFQFVDDAVTINGCISPDGVIQPRLGLNVVEGKVVYPGVAEAFRLPLTDVSSVV